MEHKEHNKIVMDLEERMKTHFFEVVKKDMETRISQVENVAREAAETAKKMASDNAEANKNIQASIDTVQATLKPISEIYTDLNGTKKVLKWVFYVLSFTIGFILSVRALIHIK